MSASTDKIALVIGAGGRNRRRSAAALARHGWTCAASRAARNRRSAAIAWIPGDAMNAADVLRAAQRRIADCARRQPAGLSRLGQSCAADAR